jgi:hypothetical protein
MRRAGRFIAHRAAVSEWETPASRTDCNCCSWEAQVAGHPVPFLQDEYSEVIDRRAVGGRIPIWDESTIVARTRRTQAKS